MKNDMRIQRSSLTPSALKTLVSTYGIPVECDAKLPEKGESIMQPLTRYFGIYTKFFEFSGLRIPLLLFFLQTFESLGLHLSQTSPLGLAKIIHFKMVCKANGVVPTVGLFASSSGLRRTVTGLPSRR
jgi:hypothetical protein